MANKVEYRQGRIFLTEDNWDCATGHEGCLQKLVKVIDHPFDYGKTIHQIDFYFQCTKCGAVSIKVILDPPNDDIENLIEAGNSENA